MTRYLTASFLALSLAFAGAAANAQSAPPPQDICKQGDTRCQPRAHGNDRHEAHRDRPRHDSDHARPQADRDGRHPTQDCKQGDRNCPPPRTN